MLKRLDAITRMIISGAVAGTIIGAFIVVGFWIMMVWLNSYGVQ